MLLWSRIWSRHRKCRLSGNFPLTVAGCALHVVVFATAAFPLCQPCIVVSLSIFGVKFGITDSPLEGLVGLLMVLPGWLVSTCLRIGSTDAQAEKIGGGRCEDVKG